MPESYFLGIATTAWTAIACFVALFVGILAIFQQQIVNLAISPQLSLQASKAINFSSWVKKEIFIRIPVANAGECLFSRFSASNVEVFLESISEPNTDHPFEIPQFLPIRLLWCHSNPSSPVCDRLAYGSTRLLDLGKISFWTPDGGVSTDEALYAHFGNRSPVRFEFATEVPTREGCSLTVGSFRAHFLIVGTNCHVIRKSFVITIRNVKPDPQKDIKEYFSLV